MQLKIFFLLELCAVLPLVLGAPAAHDGMSSLSETWCLIEHRINDRIDRMAKRDIEVKRGAEPVEEAAKRWDIDAMVIRYEDDVIEKKE